MKARIYSPSDIEDMRKVLVWIDYTANPPIIRLVTHYKQGEGQAEVLGLGQLPVIASLLDSLYNSKGWTFRPFLGCFGIVAERKD